MIRGCSGPAAIRLWITSSLFFVSLSFSQGRGPTSSSLPEFLLEYLKLSAGESIRYFDATVDLNSDGRQEVLVYMIGPRLCGSGGCPLLILAAEGSSYRVVTRTSITQTPIRVLDESSSGWRNLGVRVAGGGTIPGYQVVLKFDGKSYPRNPTVSPAYKPGGRLSGKVLIPAFKSALEGKELTGR
jgi:hypothetical protein